MNFSLDSSNGRFFAVESRCSRIKFKYLFDRNFLQQVGVGEHWWIPRPLSRNFISTFFSGRILLTHSFKYFIGLVSVSNAIYFKRASTSRGSWFIHYTIGYRRTSSAICWFYAINGRIILERGENVQLRRFIVIGDATWVTVWYPKWTATSSIDARRVSRRFQFHDITFATDSVWRKIFLASCDEWKFVALAFCWAFAPRERKERERERKEGKTEIFSGTPSLDRWHNVSNTRRLFACCFRIALMSSSSLRAACLVDDFKAATLTTVK